MSVTNLEVIETRLMKPYKYPRLVYKGYLYHFHKSCSQHLRWKCNRVYSMKCPAVLRTSMDFLNPEYIAIDHDHIHEKDEHAISELRFKVKAHQGTTWFQNNTLFKPRNRYPTIINIKEGKPKNNIRFEPKNGCANINIDEEDISENIKNNKLAKFCASINQIFFIDPLDDDYGYSYTDGCEQIIKNKNLNDRSFSFEYPNVQITRYTRQQKQIESNNAKNGITTNNIRCSFLNDKIKTFNQVYEEVGHTSEQNYIVSKEEEIDGQVNESTLLPNTDKEKTTLATNINEKINNPKEKNSLISNIILEKYTLTSNTHEEINTFTSNTHEKISTLATNTYIPKENKSLISNINENEINLISNVDKDRNSVTTNTHKEINTLTTNTLTPKENKSLISNINENEINLISNVDKDRNSVTTNTHKEINTLTTNTLTPKENKSLISNINENEINLISNVDKDRNSVTTNTHKEINTLTTNTLTPKENKSLISNINENEINLISNVDKDRNSVTTNTHEEINTLTTNTHTPKENKSLISNINENKNNLISNVDKDRNSVTTNTHKEINTLTTNTHNSKENKSLISNINENKNNLISNINKDSNTVTSSIHKEINMLTTNTHTPEEKKSLITNINELKNNLISNIMKDSNTLISNTLEKINMKIIDAHTQEEKMSLISSIKKDKNTLTCNTHTPKVKKSLISNINKKKYILTRYNRKKKSDLNTNTNKKKNSLIRNSKKKNVFASNMRRDKSTLTGNIIKNKSVLTRNSYKKKNILITNKHTLKMTLTTNTHPQNNIKTTNKQKTKSALIINARKKKMYSKLKKNILKPTNQTLEMKSTPSILTSTIKCCMNKVIDNDDDITINSDNDSYYDDEEPNDIINYDNLVHDDMITHYCENYWPTISSKLRDPLTGIEVYRSILFNKACLLFKNEQAKIKLNIQKIKSRNLQWQLKFECLEFKMQKIIESIRSDGNTRHISIKNQNQKDTTLCKKTGVLKKETNEGIKKKVFTDLKNNITPENFKTSKSFQQSLNSENRNLTESDTDIKTTKSKEIKTNISSTQVMVDLIKNIPQSTTASILSPKSLKSKKRNLTGFDTCITMSRAKIKKTEHSSIPNLYGLDIHIPPETTILRISPEPFCTKHNDLIQSDSFIKTIESNESLTPLLNIPKASKVSPKLLNNQKSNLIQSNTSIEVSQSLFKEFNESASSAFINVNVDSPQVMTTATRLSPDLTQYNTVIEMTKSKIVESNKHSSLVPTNVCPNTTILTQNGIEIEVIEITESDMINYYESSSSASIDRNVNNSPVTTTSGLTSYLLSNQKTISTQYNTDIEKTKPKTMESTPAYIDLSVNSQPDMTSSVNLNMFTSQSNSTQSNTHIECYEPSTSMSTDLRNNIPIFSSSFERATTPLNSNLASCLEDQSMVTKHTTFDLLAVDKDAGLVTLSFNTIKHEDWKSPQRIRVDSKKVSDKPLSQNIMLPVAIKRVNFDSSSEYPLLNMLLTRPKNAVIKLAEKNIAPVNNQMNALLPPINTIIELDKVNILNTPVNNQMNAPLSPINTIMELDKRNILNTPVNNQMNAPLPPINTIIELDKVNILNTPVNNQMNAPLPPINTIIELDKVNILNTLVNNQMNAPLSPINTIIELDKVNILNTPVNNQMNAPLSPINTIMELDKRNILNTPVNNEMNRPLSPINTIIELDKNQMNAPLSQINTIIELDKRNILNTPVNNQMNAPLSPINTIIELDKRNILNTPVNNQMNTPLSPIHTIVELDKRNILNTPVNNHMNAPLSPIHTIIELDKRNILNTPVNNHMNAPLSPINTIIELDERNILNTPVNNHMNAPLSPINTIIELDERNILNTPVNNQINAPLPPINTIIELDKNQMNAPLPPIYTIIELEKINILNTPVNNQMKVPFPPTNKIIKLDKRSFVLNIPSIPPNNQMIAAPLPDVVYESTQITNKINYQKTIQSNYSHNLHEAPHQMKPVPTGIPLSPPEII